MYFSVLRIKGFLLICYLNQCLNFKRQRSKIMKRTRLLSKTFGTDKNKR